MLGRIVTVASGLKGCLLAENNRALFLKSVFWKALFLGQNSEIRIIWEISELLVSFILVIVLELRDRGESVVVLAGLGWTCWLNMTSCR